MGDMGAHFEGSCWWYGDLYGKRDGNEWAWVVNAAPTAAAMWAERTCEVAGDAAPNACAVL